MSNEPNEAELELAQEIDAALVKKTGGVRRPMNSSYAIETIAEVLAAHRAADEGELAKALEEIAGYLPSDELQRNILSATPGSTERQSHVRVWKLADIARAALARHAAKGA